MREEAFEPEKASYAEAPEGTVVILSGAKDLGVGDTLSVALRSFVRSG